MNYSQTKDFKSSGAITQFNDNNSYHHWFPTDCMRLGICKLS